VVIGTILTVIPLYYVNNFVLSDNSPLIVDGTKGGGLSVKFMSSKIKLPDDAQNVSMLYNQDYISYIDSGVLHIKNLFDDKLSREINEENPVVYALPLDDRNIVMYLTDKDDKVEVKTYNLDNGEKTSQKLITINNFYHINGIRFSSLMNVVYIDAQTISDKVVRDEIYKIDIMKHTSLYTKGKKISYMDLMYNEDSLVYQDAANGLYIKNKMFMYNNYKKFKLLGVDKTNRVYITLVDNPSILLVVKNRKIDIEEHIDDTGYVENMSRGNNVYLIYKDHVLDLAGNKIIPKSPDAKVLDINNSSMLLENEAGSMSIEKL
jgi:hypothetical protein